MNTVRAEVTRSERGKSSNHVAVDFQVSLFDLELREFGELVFDQRDLSSDSLMLHVFLPQQRLERLLLKPLLNDNKREFILFWKNIRKI